MHGTEGVHVLDLHLDAELLHSPLADGDVGVAAQRSLFHVAVADANPHQHLAQALHVLPRFVRAAKVGLGDDLHQRHAGAVEVHQRRRRGVNGARVKQLAGVLLEVDAGNANSLATFAAVDLEIAVSR